MGFFDRFRRLSPEQLRERLFSASGDELVRLCQEHQQAVAEHFAAWQKVPDDVRSDPLRLPRYAQGLIGVAQCFAQALGDPSLLERLQGGASNPLAKWQRGLNEARVLLDAGRFAEAIPSLEAMLQAGEAMQGNGVDQLLPYTLEFLGEARFHSGDVGRVVEMFERALAIAQDVEGRLACLNSLFEAHRYLGDIERAAQCAEQQATLLSGAAAEAARKTAARVRAGEPLLRVVLQIGEQRFEQDDGPTGVNVRFLFERNRLTLRGAARLTAEGSQLASQGRHHDALGRFDDAGRIDAFDPHCRFLAALTLVHLRRHGEAVEQYDAVERLAPGWFHSRFDRWLAVQLRDGKLPHEAFLALIELEDGELEPEATLRLVDECLRRWPLAAAHLHRGRALHLLGRTEEARAALRAGFELAEESDLRSRLAVELGMLTGDDRMLRAADDPAGNPVAAAQARYLRRTRAS
jgi:tetratricopeptide (TPR) repeat protein